MDAISNFFNTLYYIFIVAPYAIIMVVLGVKLMVNWDDITHGERVTRSLAYGILAALGVLVPLSFSYPALYAFFVSFAPLLFLLPFVGFFFYIYAVTRLGQQLDQASDDIYTIARNSNKD